MGLVGSETVGGQGSAPWNSWSRAHRSPVFWPLRGAFTRSRITVRFPVLARETMYMVPRSAHQAAKKSQSLSL
jgi:hypothetical protein